jgi:tRNA nucleotidyltransferase (CCA-adding enzyme)
MFVKAISPKDLVLLSSCDNRGKIPQKNIKSFLLDRLNIYNEIMSKPFVQGKDLIANGLKPDKDFSKLLQFANKNRLAGVNKETALKQTLAYYKELKKNS